MCACAKRGKKNGTNMEKKIKAEITPRLARMMASVDSDEKLHEHKALVADSFAELTNLVDGCGDSFDDVGGAFHHLAAYLGVLDELYMSSLAEDGE